MLSPNRPIRLSRRVAPLVMLLMLCAVVLIAHGDGNRFIPNDDIRSKVSGANDKTPDERNTVQPLLPQRVAGETGQTNPSREFLFEQSPDSYQAIMSAVQSTERDKPEGTAGQIFQQDMRQKDSPFVEEDEELLADRIRWFKERHPEIESELRLKVVKDDYNARQERKARTAAQSHPEASNWLSLGPANGAGRISSIAVHPIATGTVYVGADGGGVWKTIDGGSTWTNLTDSINNLNVGAIALAPSSPNIVYVGTGSEHSSGIGLLKSTDGGNTWQFPSSIISSRFYRISVHPTNPLELVAGVSGGAIRSIDGGNTWATVVPNNPYFYVNDLKRDPTNSSILYATAVTNSGGRVLKSTNGGASFTEKTVGLPNNTDPMSIAVTPTNPQVLYVLTSIQRDLSHVYKSTDGGETWADLPGVYGSSDSGTRKILGGQASHDNTITVSPVNPNIVIAGGVDYRRSLDAGQSWSQPFCGINFNCFYVHADWTDQQYQGSTLWISNDGGVYSSPDDGSTAVEHDSGLVIREYYAMFNHPTRPNGVLAGSQDNGVDFRSDSSRIWFSMPYCDGFDSAINSLNTNIAYATCQRGQINRTKQFETNPNIFSFPPATVVTPSLPTGETWPFFTRLVIDLNNPSILYTLTSARVWRTTDGGDSWLPLSTTTTDGSTWASPSEIAVSKSNGNVLMTSSGSNVFRSTDAGNTWIKKTTPSSVFSLEIDPNDSSTAYAGSFVCIGCGPGLLMTSDGGSTWTRRDSGLPQGTVLVVRVDPINSNRLYCGTYSGVYISSDKGLNWSQLGSGLPSVNIEDLRITYEGSILRAATYGRGVWEYPLNTLPAPPIAPTSNAATNVASGSFTATWSTTNAATGYLLDVSTNIGFSNFVSVYQSLNVGDNLSRNISGLVAGATYYYRVRAYNDGGISSNSQIISVRTANFVVTNTGDNGSGSLRQAISDATPGSIIEIALSAGSTINLITAELVINKNLTLIGPGANKLTIKRSDVAGTPQFRIFRITSGDVSISGLTISNGNVSGGGGGLDSEGSGVVNIAGCTIAGNSASFGGGVYTSSGTMNLLNSTVSGNAGSGIYIGSGTLNVTNSTISGNTGGNGGGLNCQSASVNLVSSTVSGNSSPFGGGLITFAPNVSALNSLIAGNTGTNGPDVYTSTNGLLSSLGNNLIGTNSSANIASQPTDLIGTASSPIDPKVGALADNGGPTMTRALLPGSPAMDKGRLVAGLTTDQRGFARPPSSSANDIGAFEANAAQAAPPIQFRSGNYGVGEADGAADVTVMRFGDASSAASVSFATSNGTAKEGKDYVAAYGVLNFAAGETSKTFTVLIIDNAFVDGARTVNLVLGNPTGAALSTPATAALTISDNDISMGANPIDQPRSFVQFHYYDFLSRYPDQGGWDFWTNEITSCGSNQACIDNKRINVSAAYFLSIEFQQTGYLVERIYKAAYGDATGNSTFGSSHALSVPIIRLNEFLPDTQEIGFGVVVGQTGWEQAIENNKVAFTSEFVQRSRFTTAYPTSMTPMAFVDKLFANAGVTPLAADRTAAINEFGSATTTTDAAARGRALRRVAENGTLTQQEFNRAFVLMQYFGYLRRNPNDLPDSDYPGYDFWLTKLNQFNGNYQSAEMVKAFIVSGEYRQRFGP